MRDRRLVPAGVDTHSRRLTLPVARSKRVRVRVRRRIRPGRYRLRAGGMSAEGRRVTGKRLVRVRRAR